MSHLRNVIFSLVPLLVVFSLVEATCRILRNHRPPHYADVNRLSLLAYTSKPWFSEPFLIASSMQRKGWYTPSGTRLVFPTDCNNQYFTVTGGVRETVGFTPKENPDHAARIFLLGGSTTYCIEVPDRLTWASQLQFLLNERIPTPSVRILNYGVTTVNSSQETERLDYEIRKGNIPTVCILFNGVNDVYQGVMYNNPEGTLFDTAVRKENSFFRRLRRNVAFIDLTTTALHDFNKKIESYFPKNKKKIPEREAQEIEALAKRTAAIYERNIRAAHELCEKHGVSFFVFLQPNLFSLRRPLTPYEKEVFDRTEAEKKQMFFDAAYPLLKAKIKILQQEGVNAYDFSGIFDENTKPIFLDDCHVESDGNAIIAAAIGNVLTPALQDRFAPYDVATDKSGSAQ